MENGRQQRWIYLDVCKILSMLFIVVTNVAATRWVSLSPAEIDWKILTIYNSMSRFSVPLFFMINGALMLNEKKEMSIRTLYTKYLIQLVTAFLFWSTIYALFTYWMYSPEKFQSFDLYEFVDTVLRGDPYRHWFIFLIISVFLVIPILRAVARDESATRYLLILWGIFSLLISTLRHAQLLFPQMPGALSKLIVQIIVITDRIKPTMVLDYTGYFLLGHYIHVRKFTRREGYVAAGAGLVAIAYTALMTILVSVRDGAPSQEFYGNVSTTIALTAAAIMIVTKVFTENKWYSDRVYKTILYLSTGAFGIFLIHAFLLNVLMKLNIDALSLGPVLSTPVISVGVALISVSIGYLLKRIPKVGDYLV